MKYYVYEHFHPETKKVVYIGKGTGGRAWSYGYSKSKTQNRGNRTKEHQAWMNELFERGYTPDQFVRVVKRGLTNKEALSLELAMLDESKYAGLFNKITPTKITREQVSNGRHLVALGDSYATAAKKLDLSTMTLWRALNGKTKGINYGL